MQWKRAYAEVLSSCQTIVDKLKQKGQITADETKKACAYFSLHEKLWPNQPEITDGAKLYFDDYNITETSEICGFNNYCNFIRTFKKVVGITPGKYRNTMQK